MKNPFTQPTSKRKGSRVLLLITMALLVFNTFAKPLPPPTPTVVLTPPSGANCFTSLTASGCDVGNTVYWYINDGSFYATGSTITVNSSSPTYIIARCYDGVSGTTGPASPEYKALPAGYTQLSPNTTQTLCASVTSILFNASSAASGLTYQWRKGFANVSGATGSSYTATAIDYYNVIATSGSCTYSSSFVQVVNPTQPTINSGIGGPCGSKSLSLNVYNVSGGAFQWKLNGTNISGATGSSYSAPIASAAGSYTVEYTSGGCVTTSLPFVFALPTIALAPAVSPACSATLTSTCPSGNYTSWFKYNGSTYVYEGNTTNSPYAFPVTSVASDYKAICGFNTTYCVDEASNTVTAIPTNYTTISPVSGNICGTGSVLLTATTTFTGVTFQWQKGGVNISGATSATYSATTAGSYGVITTKGSCNYTSAVSTIAVTALPNPPVSITKNPTTAVNPGASVILTASACASGSTLKWLDDATSINPRTVTPTTTTTYSAKCVVGTCESATSTSATVDILSTITVTSPTPTAICSNAGTVIPVTFTTTGNLTGNYTVALYQTIQFGGSNTSTTIIASATTATNSANITLPANQQGNGNNGFGNIYQYYIKVINGATVSNNYNTNLSPRANVTASFTGTCGSQTITLSTQTFYTTGTLQWKKNGVNVGTPITTFPPSGPSATYTTTDNGTYTIDYTDNICTTTSNSTVFAQNTVPVITLNQSTSPSCTTTLTATNCSGTVSWYLGYNGISYFNQTNNNPYVSTTSTSTSYYRATCTLNSCESAVSNVVITTPNFTEVIPNNPTICSTGGSILLNASSANSGLTYQWRLNGTNITGATSSSYTATTGGNYSVFTGIGACIYTSSSVFVNTVSPPTISITSTQSSPATITNGQSLLLTSNGCISNGGTVAWSNGATTSTITVAPSSNTNYTFTCTKPPCVVTSSAFVINVNALAPPTVTSSSPTTCTGTSVTITGTCPSSSTISWNTAPVQTTSVITVSPSVTTPYTATCTLGAATSIASISIGVFDGAITSLSSGNWTDASTWSCNCIPASCNDVTVETGHIVIIPTTLTGRLKNLIVKGSVDMKSTSMMKMK